LAHYLTKSLGTPLPVKGEVIHTFTILAVEVISKTILRCEAGFSSSSHVEVPELIGD
jgi:hypothetical protein